jgi:prolyl oligopeptidase
MKSVFRFLLVPVFAVLLTSASSEDPFLWLEDVNGEAAINWVRERNDKSLALLQSDARFQTLKSEAAAIIQDRERIPFGTLMNGCVHNHWQDERHVRGIWRRARYEDYVRKVDSWETILDIDELAAREGENWVLKGYLCLEPANDRCLVSLSRGGADATVVREFDVRTKEFVAGGFYLPEAKSNFVWLDENTLIVGSDFGPGSLTSSGYPRILRTWKRGESISQASNLYQGENADVSVNAWTTSVHGESFTIVERNKSFFESERFLLTQYGLEKLSLPDDSILNGYQNGRVILKLASEWQLAAAGAKQQTQTYPVGALVAVELNGAEVRAVEPLYLPTARSSVESAVVTKDFVFVNILDNVQGKILKYRHINGIGWQSEPLVLPEAGVTSIQSADVSSNQIFVVFENFITPDQLYTFDDQVGATGRLVRSMSEKFSATDLVVSAKEARSADGTMVPYFLVHKQGIELNGSTPTILYGYGGFQISMLPYYSGTIGKLWLERGGAYALANIRGGGEFGPAWHQAALKHNRQRAYDDFIAIAEDLIATGITSPRRLGISGGSNGGLLVGAVMAQRPELFHAVLCSVPLLDMLRFHLLLAGASWIGEYGNPDIPEERATLAKYSPYQNIFAEKSYPEMFITTSTRDDRVHPGHARKMAAKLESFGQPVLYYENIEGGHGGAANLEQRVRNAALQYTYFHRKLMD